MRGGSGLSHVHDESPVQCRVQMRLSYELCMLSKSTDDPLFDSDRVCGYVIDTW